MSSRSDCSLVYTVSSRPPKGSGTLFKNKKGEKEGKGGREEEKGGEGKGKKGKGGERRGGEGKRSQLLPGIPVHN